MFRVGIVLCLVCLASATLSRSDKKKKSDNKVVSDSMDHTTCGLSLDMNIQFTHRVCLFVSLEIVTTVYSLR